jgi:hypothetical protein
VVRAIDVTAPLATYTAADQTEDFGSLPGEIAVRVAQISASEGPGTPVETTIHV